MLAHEGAVLRDDNDRHVAGELPDDPLADTEPVGADVRARAAEAERRKPVLDRVWPAGGDVPWIADRVWTEPPPPRRMLLWRDDKGALPAGRVGMIAAQGGAGKSWALIQLALAVSTARMKLSAPSPGSSRHQPLRARREWLDTYRVDEDAAGPVALIMGEETADEVARRLHHAARGLGLAGLASVPIVPIPLAGAHCQLVADDGGGTWGPSPMCQALRDRLSKAGVEWSLLIFDPLSRFAGPDAEIDNAAATSLVAELEAFTSMPGKPTVLVAHHVNKSSRTAGAGRSTAARGSSALTDGVRWQANMTVPTRKGPDGDVESDRFVWWRVVKSNYAPMGEPVALERSESSGVLLSNDSTAAELRAWASPPPKQKSSSPNGRKAPPVPPMVPFGEVLE